LRTRAGENCAAEVAGSCTTRAFLLRFAARLRLAPRSLNCPLGFALAGRTRLDFDDGRGHHAHSKMRTPAPFVSSFCPPRPRSCELRSFGFSCASCRHLRFPGSRTCVHYPEKIVPLQAWLPGPRLWDCAPCVVCIPRQCLKCRLRGPCCRDCPASCVYSSPQRGRWVRSSLLWRTCPL